MGQKSHPKGLRLGIIREHDSVWIPGDGESYAQNVHLDLKIREKARSSIPVTAGVSRVFIKRTGSNNSTVNIHAARPGSIIGRKGEGIEKIRDDLSLHEANKVNVNVSEIRKPELDAYLVAQNVCGQLERRVMFRRAVKKVIASAMRSGAKGIKVMVSGRLGGAEIARTEKYHEGRVPLHTFRADVDYGFFEAHTTYGIIGVKVWIFKGDVLGKKKQSGGAKSL